MNDSFDVYVLNPWDEARGHLVEVKDNMVIFEDFTILIPYVELQKIHWIKSLEGEIVTILRTDLSDSPYLIVCHHSRKKERVSTGTISQRLRKSPRQGDRRVSTRNSKQEN